MHGIEPVGHLGENEHLYSIASSDPRKAHVWIFSFSLQCFLVFQVRRTRTSFVKWVPKYFMPFDVITNGIFKLFIIVRCSDLLFQLFIRLVSKSCPFFSSCVSSASSLNSFGTSRCLIGMRDERLGGVEDGPGLHPG